MKSVVQVKRQDPAQTAQSFGVQIYREAYTQGVSVSQLLERMDPTSELPESERRLDAFERVMRAAGLISNPVEDFGIRASTWEEATETAENRALLHEFGARIWRQAARWQPMTLATRALLLSGDAAINTLANQYADDTAPRAKRLVAPIPIEAVVARTTAIDGADYRTLYITDDLNTDAYRLKRVAEGANIPATTLVTGEHTLRAHKYGRALRATYEQLRRQRLDRIAFIIRRMAVQAEADKVAMALDVIVNGDGNANTAATVIAQTALHAGSAAGTLTLQAWITFLIRFTRAYMADTVLAQEAALMQLLLLNIGQTNTIPFFMLGANASLGAPRPINDQLGSGQRYGVTSDAPALKLVTFDSSATVERVTEIGGNVSEVERFVLNQTQVLTLTEVEGYGTIDPNAAKVLNINA